MNLRERGLRAWGAARTLMALPAEERRLYGECWVALGLARLRSRHFRLDRSASLRETAGAVLTTEKERAVLGAFSEALRMSVVGTPCLARAMALAQVLHRHGASARVAVGMRRGDRGLEGHAWVESRGRVVGEAEAGMGSFVRFETAG